MNDYQKLSADLSRVAEFLVQGNQSLADKFSDRAVKMYSNLPGKIGNEEIGDYILKIKDRVGGEARVIERAYTAADILARRNYGPK